MKKKLLCFILLLLSVVQPCFAGQKVIMAITGIEADSRIYKVTDAFVQKIARNMQINIELKVFPAKRAATLLKAGLIHAELARISAFSLSNPTAIKVSEPIGELLLYAYARADTVKISGWESLQPYRIVTVRGLKFAEKFLQNNDTHELNSIEQAVRYLYAKRADILISDPWVLDHLLLSGELKNLHIQRLEPPLMRIQLYSFFSSRYPHLAREFNRALLEVKKQGVIRQ
ncbi:MAG: hypothetical protein OFPI_40610 [Osedax symbiont Rs2]|nr:MAG: hypothetical protein OFPI_40610 [Osedax symbiont Rs2]